MKKNIQIQKIFKFRICSAYRNMYYAIFFTTKFILNKIDS